MPGFKLEGKFTEKWARLGNSVPPLFMRAIAEHIHRILLTPKESREGDIVKVSVQVAIT
jgi:hypothetical protein